MIYLLPKNTYNLISMLRLGALRKDLPMNEEFNNESAVTGSESQEEAKTNLNGVDINAPEVQTTSKKNAVIAFIVVIACIAAIMGLVYVIAKSHFHYLMDAGVHIHTYTPGFNHMKSAIADDELAFVGTINFDFRSLVHHFECGTLLYKNPCLKEIREDFDEMIAQSQEVHSTFKLGIFARCFCSLAKLFTTLL